MENGGCSARGVAPAAGDVDKSGSCGACDGGSSGCEIECSGFGFSTKKLEAPKPGSEAGEAVAGGGPLLVVAALGVSGG